MSETVEFEGKIYTKFMQGLTHMYSSESINSVSIINLRELYLSGDSLALTIEQGYGKKLSMKESQNAQNILNIDGEKYEYIIRATTRRDTNQAELKTITPLKERTGFNLHSYSMSQPYSNWDITFQIYSRVKNTSPELTLETEDNRELFEGGKLTLNGTISDPDLDDIVTVKYQVNNSTPKNIKAFVSQGTVEDFSKTLTYKDGSLYDGNNLILGNMLDGEHKVLVWAEDNNGGKTDVEVRNFTTKRNRYPVVEVTDYPKSLSNLSLLNELEFKFKVTDLDEGNTVKGSYILNNSDRISVDLDDEGNGEFKLSLSDLIDGVNIVEIIGTDNYDFDTVRKVKLDVTLNKFKPDSKTYRYELLPDSDLTSHGIVSWVKHRPDTDIKLSYSTDKVQGFHDMEEKEVTSPTGMKETEFQTVFDDSADKVYLELKDAQNATLIMGGVDTDEPFEG